MANYSSLRVRRFVWLGVLALVLCPVLDAGAQEAPEPVGDFVDTWHGTLDVGGTQLRMVVHIEAAGDSLTATMDSPDQGATGIPVQQVTATDDSLALVVSVVNGRFDGALDAEGETIEGTWTQNGQSFPLTLKRGEVETTQVRRPQHPEPPYPYDTTNVTIRNPAAGVTLAGTLSLPTGQGPHPAVVLVSGSGPQDRRSVVADHALFRVVADHLTRQGIAVFRYDERGVGASTGSFSSATTADFASDVRAIVEELSARSDLGPLGVYGHSEGGLVAPLVARESEAVDFLVLLAPPGVPGVELIPEQVRRIARAGGASASRADSMRTVQRRLVTAVAQASDSASAAQQVGDLLREFGVSGSQVDRQVEQLTTPWFRSFLTQDPVPVLRDVDGPVLVLFGEKDLQVPPEQNRPPVETALQASTREEVTVETVPGVNHLFQPADTGLPKEYRSIETTMAPEVLETITDWILSQHPEE